MRKLLFPLAAFVHTTIHQHHHWTANAATVATTTRTDGIEKNKNYHHPHLIVTSSSVLPLPHEDYDEHDAPHKETKFGRYDVHDPHHHDPSSDKGGEHHQPPTPCVDSTGKFRYQATQGKTCSWVQQKKSRREKLCEESPEVKRNCPVTCGICCDNDPQYSFLENSSSLTCESDRITLFCNDEKNNRIVREACPLSCGVCTTTSLKRHLKGKQAPKSTKAPTRTPSTLPSSFPSALPSNIPSTEPSTDPSGMPSSSPSLTPSVMPSNIPSVEPSSAPSLAPSAQPSLDPSLLPSSTPSLLPSLQPSVIPSMTPSISFSPTFTPSITISDKPSMLPSQKPSLFTEGTASSFVDGGEATGNLEIDTTTESGSSGTISFGGVDRRFLSSATAQSYFSSFEIPADSISEMSVECPNKDFEFASGGSGDASFGLMIRETKDDPSFPYIKVFKRQDTNNAKTISAVERNVENGSENIVGQEITLSSEVVSLKIIKEGNNFSLYFKLDNGLFRLFHRSTINMSPGDGKLHAGLFVASESADVDAYFDKFIFKKGYYMQQRKIGVGTSGEMLNFAVNEKLNQIGTATITSGGGDIENQSDGIFVGSMLVPSDREFEVSVNVKEGFTDATSADRNGSKFGLTVRDDVVETTSKFVNIFTMVYSQGNKFALKSFERTSNGGDYKKLMETKLDSNQISMKLLKRGSLYRTYFKKHGPDEIYKLAGTSNVADISTSPLLNVGVFASSKVEASLEFDSFSFKDDEKCEDFLPDSGKMGGICKCFNGFSFDDDTGTCKADKAPFAGVPSFKILHETNEVLTAFAGSYAVAEGGFNQDFDGGGGVIGESDGSLVTMIGNAWKIYALSDTGLTVNDPANFKTTWLEFNFESIEDAEGHAICLDENEYEDTVSRIHNRCIAIANNSSSVNQVNKWSNVEKVNKDDSGTYKVNVGEKLFRGFQKNIKFLALIQDNDNSPFSGRCTFSNVKVYDEDIEAEKGPPETFRWEEDDGGTSDVVVSTHSSLVSVSKDGNNAIYEHNGDVHLIKKTTDDSSCPDDSIFPGCLETEYVARPHSGIYDTRQYSEDENGGWSDNSYKGFVRMKCLDAGQCDIQQLSYPAGGDNLLQYGGAEWTGWFSDSANENDSLHTGATERECKNNYLVAQVDCADANCKYMNLLCRPLVGGYQTSEIQNPSDYFGRNNHRSCPDGNWIYGVGCNPGLEECQQLRIRCRKVEKVIPPDLVHKNWPDYYLLPPDSDDVNLPERCQIQEGHDGHISSQEECHLAGIAVGNQINFINLDWKNVNDHSSASEPCGCYIKNKTIISYNTVTSGCASSSNEARLVCKPISPSRTQDVTIDRPPSIEESSGQFGKGAKVMSEDASVIAIAAPNANKVAIYTNNGSSTATFRNVVDNGEKPAISDDGFAVAVLTPLLAAKCKVLVYGKTDGVNPFKESGDSSTELSCNEFNDGIGISHQANAIDIYNSEQEQKKYGLTCNANNTQLETGREDPILCICADGFLNSGPSGGKIVQQGFLCINSLASENIVVTSSSIEFSILKETADIYTQTQLMKRANDNDIEIKLTKSKFQDPIDSASGKMKAYTISQLEPGTRYTIILSTDEDSSRTLSFQAVTTCSCGDDDADKTGKPKNVKIKQENGHVTFDFRDNSKCETAFSFTRSDDAEEFLGGISESGVTFTSDFFLSSAMECNAKVETELDASDDLAYSKLTIGKLYMYCIRAVHSTHYMDHPLGAINSDGKDRQVTSSDETCTPHKIHWEASIHGKITTKPNAGSLPIEDVKVTWELLDSNHAQIGCTGCSGNGTTTEGGTFDIVFNVDHPLFKDKNYVDVPVKIKFLKMSGAIDHKFLCNEGEDDCSGDIGTIVYLQHLQFKEPVHVYDDTSLPFSGKVFIADTTYLGSEGCMLSNVEVCLIQETQSTTHPDEELGCDDTASDGTYSIPVIIGTRIDNVRVDYHGHAFRPSLGSAFKEGTVIEENGYYGDNDFEDFEKARLFVEVVGGVCDKHLGTSKVHMKIRGCPWNGKTELQREKKELYQSVPAHVIDVQIKDVTDSANSRIEPIHSFFQGVPPLVRTIDLRDTNTADGALGEADEAQNVTTSKGITSDDNLRNSTAGSVKEVEEEEEEKMELVRFQFDGTLKMYVTITNDALTCSSYDAAKYKDDADELHVIEYMTPFNVTVELKYEIIQDTVYCDIMDDNMRLKIDNYVGIDNNEGFDEFLEAMKAEDAAAAALLEKCRGGECLRPIKHDEDAITGVKSRAHVREEFATGRPNIAPPYTKIMLFSVQGGTAADVQHKAAIVVQGYYSKGPGNSFALPTHKPIMVLRDPPGGLSTATYENVKTTIALETSSSSTTLHHHFGIEFKTKFEQKFEICIGGGIAVMSLACKELAKIKGKARVFGYEHDAGGITSLEEKTRSTEFTTTWSYETSDDPWTAGAMSDIFVVPNLNVMYRKVKVVNWDNVKCEVEEVSDGELPEITTINLEDEKNQQALAFFSRYHVESVKLPELKQSAKNIEVVKTDCDCVNQDDDFMCQFGEDEEASCGALKTQVTFLNNAYNEWKENLKPKEDFKSNSIVNWFEKVGSELMNNANGEKNLAIDPHHSSALAPPTLLSGAKEVESAPKKPNGEETTLEAIKRIQISGGGSTFSMTLTKEKMWDKVGLSCWDGCNGDYENEIKGPGIDESEGSVLGIGFEMQLLPYNLKVHVNHESTKGQTDEESTSIGFTLGDEDEADEFVVDLYYDEEFGTIIFDTVAGRSKCPHEVGTAAVEDPSMEITKFPSQFVFPDDPMIFEVTISNVGVGKESLFTLYAKDKANSDGLGMIVDGAPFTESREYSNIESNRQYKKTVIVNRGPLLYKYKGGVDLTFESACEDNDSARNDLTASTFNTTKSVTRTLFNSQYEIEGVNETEKFIEFIEPCPKVEWAGELLRDRGFVVNTASTSQSDLLVTVTNPRYQEKKFHNMTSDRLKDVNLSYRKLGDILWKTAMTEITTKDENGNDVVELKMFDFAALYQYEKEDSYGYSSMKWSLSTVAQGTYEIKVGTRCEELGGPADIDRFDAPTLTGVIDVIRPEQYGKELPLRESVLIGEEISIIFTEPLLCEKPFSFDLEVDIQGTDYRFDREELLVVCEGRRIGFQIDPTVGINVEDILGKTFSVELGRIGAESVSDVFDVNGNGLDPLVGNIEFEKKFGEVNLREAGTRFLLTMNDIPCADNTEDDIKANVVSALGLTSSANRILLDKLNCHHVGDNRATAEVTIAPPSSVSGGRRALREEEEEDHSVDLFYQVRDAALEVEAGTRKLSSFRGNDVGVSSWSFAVSDMKILPSASDKEMLKTDPNLIEEEEELLYLASLGDTGSDKQNDVILHELRMGPKHEDKKLDMDAMQNHEDEKLNDLVEILQNHEDEKREAERKHEDEKMKAMQKQMKAMQKHEDEKLMDLVETIQKREDAKREADHKREDEKTQIMLEEMQIAMKKHEDEKTQIMLQEMQTLRIQLTVVTLVCVAVSVAAFLKLKQ